MKTDHTLLTLLLAAAIAFGVARTAITTSPTAQAQAKETAFARVMRTNTLRCGYYVFPPATIRDPATNKMSGLSVDMMNILGKNAGLKIEWTEETDWNNWVMGIEAGRFDAVCTPMWPGSNIARVALFTKPIMYSSINAYAREDDHRFDDNLAAANDPSVTVEAYESDPTEVIAQLAFPKAKRISLPSGAPTSAAAQDVVANKADILLWDENAAYTFNKNSPKKVRNVAPASPLKVMPFELLVGINEPQLRDFLDVAIQELQDSGEMGRLIIKWQQTPTSFFHIAKPYSLKGAAP